MLEKKAKIRLKEDPGASMYVKLKNTEAALFFFFFLVVIYK